MAVIYPIAPIQNLHDDNAFAAAPNFQNFLNTVAMAYDIRMTIPNFAPIQKKCYAESHAITLQR